MMKRMCMGTLGVLALCVLASGCSSECSSDGDCFSKGNGYFCVSGTCKQLIPPQTDCDPACPTGQVCDKTDFTCVECLADTDCATGETCDTSTDTCQTTQATCNPACSGTTPVCDTATLTCVECEGDGDCASGATCDAATHTCKAQQTTCDPACSGSTPVCDPSNFSCVECLKDTDCTGGDTCDTTSHTCTTPQTGCTADTECSTDANGHVCVSGVCGCNADTDCASGDSCDTTTHACFSPSAEIQAVIDTAPASGTPDTGLTLPVNNVLVTYVKPAVGSEASGFFVQADQTGPALFVEWSASPMPSVGDEVSFMVTETTNLNALIVASAIANAPTVGTSGNDVSGLVQDLTNEANPLPPNNTDVGPYDAELVKFTSATIANDFQTSGDYSYAEMASAAFGADPANPPDFWDLEFRIPTSLLNTLGLVKGCTFTLAGVPMWRDGYYAQPTVWMSSDIQVLGCPAPTVVGAVGTNPGTVVVSFDSPIDAASITAPATQFTFTAAAPATTLFAQSAAVETGDPTKVDVVLQAATQQSPGTSYTVTVSGVKATNGQQVSTTSGNQATFNGYSNLAQLVITEINPNVSGTNDGDLVELQATTDGSIENITLEDATGSSPTTKATLPAITTVKAGDVVLIHVTSSNTCVETTAKNQCPAASNAHYSDTAWDVLGGGSGFGYSSKVVEIVEPDGTTIQDAAAFTKPSVTASSYFVPAVQAIEDAGLWTGASGTCTDLASCQADSVDWTGLSGDGSDSVTRTVLTVPGSKGQWGSVGTSSFGS